MQRVWVGVMWAGMVARRGAGSGGSPRRFFLSPGSVEEAAGKEETEGLQVTRRGHQGG